MEAPAHAAALGEAYASCEALVKEADRTAWLASLFAPAECRPGLHALMAFAIEASSVRGKVREPLAGELRLQWWIDAIEGETRGDVRGHPVAAALLDTIRRHHVGRAGLTGFLDAKRVDLYDDPIPTLPEFDARADRTEGALIVAQAEILAGRPGPPVVEAAHHAGRAMAVSRSLRALGHAVTPLHVTVPLDLLRTEAIGVAELQVRRPTPAVQAALARFRRHAQDELDALRRLRPSLDDAAAPAFLLASLIGPSLAGSKDRDPFGPPSDLPQWRQQWRLWRAAGNKGVL